MHFIKKLAVLDANLMGRLASRSASLQQQIKAYFDGLRSQGYTIVITDATVSALAANQNSHTRGITVKGAMLHCDGIIWTNAGEILKIELLDNANEIIRSSQEVLPIDMLSSLESALEYVLGIDNVREAYQNVRLRTAALKQYKQILDSEFKRMKRSATVEMFVQAKNRLSSFEVFVREEHRNFLRFYFEHSRELGHIESFDCPGDDEEFELVWNQCQGWRIAVLGLMGNFYRWATRDLLKGEGSMSDIHTLIEVAYADMFLTADKELAGCGGLINSIQPTPRITLWPLA
jgi:hypothetical protein